MQKTIENLVMTRCEEAKLEDERYMECERSSNNPNEVQAESETVCYLKGVKDTILTLKILGLLG